jgi:hypothetical protein
MGGEYERRDDYRLRSRSNNLVTARPFGKTDSGDPHELMKVISPEAYQHEIEVAKLMEEKGRLRLVDWLIFALAVAAALTVAWRFLNPFGVSI